VGRDQLCCNQTGEEKAEAAVAELTKQLLEQVHLTIYEQNLAAIVSPTD
jgi:hypothetical protein